MDRLHRFVGWLQTDVVFLLVEALERHIIVDHRDHPFAVGGGRLLLDDDVVAVLDMAFDHGVAAHLQDESIGAAEDSVDLEPFVSVLFAWIGVPAATLPRNGSP